MKKNIYSKHCLVIVSFAHLLSNTTLESLAERLVLVGELERIALAVQVCALKQIAVAAVVAELVDVTTLSLRLEIQSFNN